MARWTASAK
jgi:hypothetical protein